MDFSIAQPENQKILLPFETTVTLHLKREDTIHKVVSGNKYRKLKYNLQEAKARGCDTVLTFGGAFSNHIAAVAAAGQLYGFKTIGVIRGEELETKINENSTLRFAKQQGMLFKFVDRTTYRNKTDVAFLEALRTVFGTFYLIPEGGTNALAVKGCEEILSNTDKQFDVVCCAVGTGGTISGIINSASPKQKILGFPALKGSFLHEDISKLAASKHWELIADYHFGGYAKVDAALIHFINDFKQKQNIQLDPVYTGKLMFGVIDLIRKGYFPEHANVLAIHTGGLQGIQGMNSYLKKKKMPLIA